MKFRLVAGALVAIAVYHSDATLAQGLRYLAAELRELDRTPPVGAAPERILR